MAFEDVKRVVKNAPYRHTWVFRDNNGNIASSPASPTVAYFAIDACGGITVPAASPAVQVSTGGFLHYLDLTAAEMTGDLIEIIITASGVRAEYANLKPEPNLHSGVAQAGASTSITLAATAEATSDYYNGAQIEIVRGTGQGQIRTITDYSSGLVATLDRAWITTPDNTSIYLVHPRTGTPLSAGIRAFSDIREINGDATAAQMLEKLYEGAFIASAVNDVSPTTTSFTGGAGLSTTADFYNNMMLVFTSGTLKGIPRRITDYATDRTITTDAFPVAPTNADTFLIIALVV